jgi:hypothetical protein
MSKSGKLNIPSTVSVHDFLQESYWDMNMLSEDNQRRRFSGPNACPFNGTGKHSTTASFLEPFISLASVRAFHP